MSNYSVQISLDARDNASDDFKRVNSELDELDKGTKKSTESMSGLEKGAELVAKAMAAMYLLDAAGEINKLGAEANAAERTFTQLSGGVDQAAKNLDMMRSATRNTVDDMVLQRESNRLLLMELAATGEEASKLTGIAVSLGKAMGNDAAQSAADFAALLANQSIPRLDTFGISSAKVRQRIEELKASGMGMEQAFNTAVIEQGEAAISRLGDTLDKAATGTEKLNTRLENLKQNLGQGVNNVVDTAANTLDQMFQIIEIRSGNSSAQQAAKAQADSMARAFSDEYTYAISQYMGMETFDTADAALAWVNSIDSAFASVIANPSLMQNKEALMEALIGVPDEQKSQFADAILMSLHDKSVSIAIEQENEVYRQQQVDNARKNVLAYVNSFADTMRVNAGKLSNVADIFNIFQAPSEATLWERQRQGIAAATDELNTFVNAYGDMWPLLDINNATDVGTLDNLLGSAQEDLASLQAQAAQGFIPDADVQKAQGIVDNLQKMSDKITNIQGMTLDGLLGRKKGDGSLVQLQNMAYESAAKSGLYTDAELAAIQKQFEMSSGRETGSGSTLENDVMPVITEIGQNLGKEAMDNAIKNVNAFLEQAAYQGLSDAEIAAGLTGATGYTPTGASGAQFEVKQGETPGQVAARMGMSVDQVLALTGAKNAYSMGAGTYGMGSGYEAVAGFDPSQYVNTLVSDTTVQAVADMQSDIEQMGEDMPGVTSQFTEVNTQVTGIQSAMEALVSKVHKVTVQLDIQGMDVLNTVLGMFGGGSGSGGGNSGSVQNNGGRVFGADPRVEPN